VSRRTAERAAARATLLRAAAATTERLTAAWRAALDTPNEVGAGGDYHRQVEAEAAYTCDPAGFYPEGRPVWRAEGYCGEEE